MTHLAAALAWCLAHQAELATVAAALVAVSRAIPASFWTAHPRLGALARFGRAAFPDVIKSVRALAPIFIPRGGTAEQPRAAGSPRPIPTSHHADDERSSSG
jgi:hypothetical protein